MVKKTLILKSDKGDFELFYLQAMKKYADNSVDVSPIFKKLKRIEYFVMLLHIQKLKLPYHELWYAEWKKNIQKYNNVIIFDRNYNWDIVEFIHKKNPNCRIIVWYWNTISNNRIPIKYRKYCEEWSFDIDDCKKYSIKYNTQFSFKQIFHQDNEPFKFDTYFVGRDKGRMNILQSLKNQLKAFGKEGIFIVVKDKTSIQDDGYAEHEISYLENINYLKKTRSVLEIVQNGQSGITVRCVEALFLNLKIITNNCKLQDFNFYDPHRIFVMDNKTKIEEIVNFLDQKMLTYNSELSEQYDYQTWLKNFKLN